MRARSCSPGSFVKTVWVNAGDRVKMELDGLGTVEAKFT